MFRRKQQINQSALDEIRVEMELIKKFSVDARTEAGRNLIDLLELSIQNTIKELTTKEVDKFETDAKMVFFLASCRSKLQTLIALKNFYINSDKRVAELNIELEKILPKEE